MNAMKSASLSACLPDGQDGAFARNGTLFKSHASHCSHVQHYEDLFAKRQDDVWYGAVLVVPDGMGTKWFANQDSRQTVDMLTRRLGMFIADHFGDLMRQTHALQKAWLDVCKARQASGLSTSFRLEQLYSNGVRNQQTCSNWEAVLPIAFSLAWDGDARCSFLIIDAGAEQPCADSGELGTFAGALVREAAARVVAEWEQQNGGLHSTKGTVRQTSKVAPLQSSVRVCHERSGVLWSRALFCPPWDACATNGWNSALTSKGLLHLVNRAS